MLDHIGINLGLFQEHLRKLHAPSRCMIMISLEIKTKSNTTAISYNGRSINQYSFINGIGCNAQTRRNFILP